MSTIRTLEAPLSDVHSRACQPHSLKEKASHLTEVVPSDSLCDKGDVIKLSHGQRRYHAWSLVCDISGQISVHIALHVSTQWDSVPLLSLSLRLLHCSLRLSIPRALYQCHTQIPVPAMEKYLYNSLRLSVLLESLFAWKSMWLTSQWVGSQAWIMVFLLQNVSSITTVLYSNIAGLQASGQVMPPHESTYRILIPSSADFSQKNQHSLKKLATARTKKLPTDPCMANSSFAELSLSQAVYSRRLDLPQTDWLLFIFYKCSPLLHGC